MVKFKNKIIVFMCFILGLTLIGCTKTNKSTRVITNKGNKIKVEKSGKNVKENWFYWINGILAPIGIAEYKPVDVVSYDPKEVEKTDKYHIFLGTWNDLEKNSKRLKDMNWKNKLEGVYVEFKEGKLKNSVENIFK